MAQNAELLLKVGLDLSHFRQQLTTIGSQLAGQPLSINVKFDRAKIVSEFRLLDRYIRNKKFYVEINTNLKTEVDRAVRLTELLKNMPKGGGATRTPGVVEKGFSQAQLRSLGQNIKPLYKAAADAGLIAFNQAIANNVSKIAKELAEVGRSSIAGLLNGLNSGDAQIKAAAQSLGQTLIQTIKTELGIASPSKETGKLGKFAAQGFEQGFVSGIVRAERSMARAIRASLMGAIREGFSNLPGMGGALVSFERQLAASVQLAVRKAVRQGLRESIVPGAKGGLLGGTGGAVTGATLGGAKALGAGVAGGVAKLTAGGIMGTAANLVRYSVDSSAYQGFVVKLYQEIIHAALSTGSQGAVIGALSVGGVVGGLAFARGASGSLILQAVTGIRNRIMAALLAVSTGDLNNIVKVMVRDVTGLVFQGAIRQLRAATAKLPSIDWPALPPARSVSTGPSSTGRLLTGAPPMKALTGAAAPSIAGLLPGTSQSTTRRESVTSGLQAIFAAGGPTFPEEPPGKLFPIERMQQMLQERLIAYLNAAKVVVEEIFDPQDLQRALRSFSVLSRELQSAVKEVFDPQSLTPTLRLFGFLSQALRDAELRTQLAKFEVPKSFGVLPETSQTTARRASIASGLEAIFAAGGPTFPEDPSGKLALSIETLKQRVDTILANYFKVVEVKVAEVFDQDALKPQLKAFDRLAQSLQSATQDVAQVMAKMIPPVTGRLLAPSQRGGAGVGAQEQVVHNFYETLRKSARVLAEAFSANSYLPQSTRKLAAAMDSAATALRLLTPAKIAGFLPSRELMDKRKFASAIQKAIVVDMTNALRQQMEGRMLPAAGGTQGFQRMLAGQQPLYRAPGVGPARPKIDMTGKVLPLEERKRFQEAISKAAEIDANNAAKAATMAARNAARAAFIALRQEVNRGLLPAAGQTFASRRKDPGVQGIFDAMTQQMGFGAGQRYAMGGPAQLRLPAAGMTGLDAAQAERVRRAYERSAARERAVLGEEMGVAGFRRTMGGTGGGVGAGGGGGGGRGGGGGGMFGGLPNISLPGSGAIRELGQEFAFATKQVLLFGQAYKLLAFIQDFPAQVGQAVGQLQSFRNTLAAISPNAEEVAASSNLILQLVEQYNIPLQSARDGFTKLYASMQPAGFSGDQVRELFTGVSKAAATFGMSSDKIDRVNYAFAQMASKGQVMSEELKGQLGDVLPGAMAIFAQAAGFKGPEAISKFSAALEDGRYKGTAMMELLNNVSIVLNQKFSAGAEGAAKTFQGAINNMQTSMTGLYESFEPIAVAFLNGVVTPVMNGIKTVTDGLNAFFSGAQTQTAGGFALAQALEQLRPSFDGIKANAMELISVLGQFANIALGLSRTLLQIAGNPVVGYLLKLYAIMLPINLALNVMRGFWALNSLQLLIFQARIASGTSTLTAFRGMMAATGATASTTAASIRAAGITLRAFFATTGVGLVVVGIGLLIERFTAMNQALADTKAKALGAAQAIRAMSQTEALQESRRAQSGIRLLNTLQARGPAYAGSEHIALSQQEGEQLRALGIPAARTLGGFRLPAASVEGYRQRLTTVNLAESEARRQQIKFEEQQATKPLSFTEIKGVGGESEGGAQRAADKAANDAKRLAEEIARQAAAASDTLFTEQQRLLVLQQTNPTAKTIVEYTNQELAIQRELTNSLKEAKSEKEKASLQEVARLKSSSNLLDLQNSLNDAGKEGLQRLEDAIKAQKEELFVNGEIEKLLREKVSPERAKQIADTRLLVRNQLESLDLSIAQAEAAAEEAKARGASVTAIENAIATLRQRRGEMVGKGAELEAGIPMAGGAKTARDYLTGGLDEARANLEQLTNSGYQLVQVAGAIGDAFGNAFKGLITGSMTAQEALAGFFSSIADHFADMVAKMIAEWLKAQLIQGFLNFLSAIIPGAGAFGSAISGLSGTGALASGGIKGFSGGSMAGLPTSYGAPMGGLGSMGSGGGFGTWTGPRFANGGIVAGPTLGLVGEGRYNEAIVPLPDGRSIPVELGGGMGGVSVVVNVDATGSEVAGNEGQAKALGSAISAAVQSEIIKQKRPGGLLAR